MQSVVEILREEVDRASNQYSAAKKWLSEISGSERNAIHSSDGMRLMDTAARDRNAAMVAYARALKRLNEFLINDTVPEDLRRSADNNSP